MKLEEEQWSKWKEPHSFKWYCKLGQGNRSCWS